TPNDNYTGSLTVNLHVNDGTDDSEQFAYQLTVVSANNIPVITDQVNPSVEIAEGTTVAIEADDLVIDDPDTDDIHTVVIDGGDNYTFSDNQLTPNDDYFGALTVNLHVNDGTDDSEQFAYQLTVTNVNDLPTLALVNDVLLTENGSPGDALLSGITSGASNEDQTLTVSIEDNTNPALFNGDPVVNYTSPNETGTITFTPAANMFGEATVTVRVS